MNVVSTFSGIGGIDLGLERAGCRVVFQAESDEWRRRVLAARFPGVPCYDDVRRVRVGESAGGSAADPVRAATDGWRREGGAGLPGGVDLVCGGFPCQDLSVAGKRAGLGGARSSLFFEFARVADEFVQPGGYVLVENVPGLLSSNSGRDFGVVLATLAELGFHDLAWRILDSRYFGVPQRRRRVFVLGRRARGERCAQVLLEPESGGGDFTKGGKARPESAVASLSGLGSGGKGGNDGQAGRIVTALTSRAGNTQDDQQSQQLVVAAPLTRGSASGEGVNPPGRRQEDDVNLVVAATVRSHPRPGSNSDGNIVYGFNAARGGQNDLALTEDGVPPVTTRHGDPGAVLMPDAAVRRLTPRECERLQGFPDDWTLLDDKTPDSRRYAALGDAVTVPVAEWIGRRLELDHLRAEAAA